MDSLSQLALGASLSVAVMGRRTAVWKAALWGGVAGLLPDLDVFIDHGDAVLNMIRHRAESHSLFFLTLFAPVLAWPVARLHRMNAAQAGLASGAGQGDHFARWCLALWLALFTHPLLDLMTIYGTQVLQPFIDTAYGVGSIFIIDPAYTLPLLVGLMLALVLRSGWGIAACRWGLGLSTAYLAWTLLAQALVMSHARDSLAAQGLPTQKVLVTPAPLQTVLWRIVVIDGDRLHEGYYSFLDGRRPVRFTAYERGADLIGRHREHPQVQRIARFSDGFFRLSARDGQLFITDLRMGQEPNYAFNFRVGPVSGDAAPPAVNRGERGDVREGLRWLWRRMRGEDVQAPGA